MFSLSMLNYFDNITAIDACIENIDISNQYLENNKGSIENKNKTIIYENILIEDIVKQNRKYDIITCLEVIEHVNNPLKFVENIAKSLNSGGIAIFSTINRNSKSYMEAIIASEYILGFTKIGTHEYKKMIKPSELNSFAKNFNMDLVDIKGMSFDPANKQFFLSDDVRVNYFISFMKN
ncbi:MAG TPA: bifunctional 2-polyprenyl-6-hydroxyphenol methylase/3-demethylubiquinol 3-O-methyltransferase UbiG [Candidatus Megaira endosymbiont of Hartmannula sinica]|nr:bifunctional 2-polyprenyl-6-hydroxyphenol methylase/3-demethylubiquinol 3-O-methyltransferase UbiG [Candidatus Megaera endosymbiont of Hartmannula sinica]